MRSHPRVLNGLSPLLEWNPQLFREVKGRLTPRNVVFTIVGSLLLQGLFLLGRISLLPKSQVKPSGNHYCTGPEFDGMGIATCLKDSAGNLVINWQHWWFDVYRLLSWSLPVALLIAGTYLLLEDLGRELRRGTLNFIRTSPQSSDRILLGKVLGVPAIPYLALALALPLYLWAALQGQITVNQIANLSLFTIAACAFFCVSSLLLAFMGGGQGWIGLIAVGLSFSLFASFWRTTDYDAAPSYLGGNLWYDLGADRHLNLAVAFAVVSLGLGTFWLWQAANRRYRNPQATLWSKTQSYWMTAGFELWLLGFFVPGSQISFDNLSQVVQIGLLNLIWFLGLIAALTPQRQALLDWARYRRYDRKPGQKFWQRSLLLGLLTHEKSPALGAIGMNLLLALALLTIWLVATQPRDAHLVFSIGGLMLLGVLQLLIAAAIVQLVLLSYLPRRNILAASSLMALLLVPPVVLGMLAISPAEAPLAWLFTISALATVKHVPAATLGFGFLLQLSLFGLATLHLTRQLHQAGASPTKALLSGSQL